MRKVKFVKDYRFATNGFAFEEFGAGQEAEVTDSCADSAIQSGAAEAVAAEAAADAAGAKARGK